MKFLITNFLVLSSFICYAQSPLDCFEKAKYAQARLGDHLTTNQAINLCAGSDSVLPVSCFDKAKYTQARFGDYLTTDQAIKLCSKNYYDERR